MRRWTVLGGAVLAIIAVHCAAFSSDSPEPGENGPDASDATSNADAATDGPLADGALGDGGALCASSHALCDDFNRTGSPFDVSRWSAQLGEGGVLATPAFATSPALVVNLPVTGVGYRLQKNIAGPLQSVHCSFRLYLEDTGSATAGIPLRISLAGALSYSAYFSLRPKTDGRPANVLEDVPGRPEQAPEFFPVGVGTWFTLEIEVPALRIWLNGIEKPVPVADGGPPPGPFASASIELGFGLYSPPDPGWRAALDDIVCDTK